MNNFPGTFRLSCGRRSEEKTNRESELEHNKIRREKGEKAPAGN